MCKTFPSSTLLEIKCLSLSQSGEEGKRCAYVLPVLPPITLLLNNRELLHRRDVEVQISLAQLLEDVFVSPSDAELARSGESAESPLPCHGLFSSSLSLPLLGNHWREGRQGRICRFAHSPL